MSFDPHKEDYLRLGMRFARSLEGMEPMAAARDYASFSRRFAQDRDSLPQTDADRAFHLVAEATGLIDYQLPFATSDEQAETIANKAHQLLDEALQLDPNCHDATRMLAAARCPNFESYYEFLQQGEPEVKARCEEAAAAAAHTDPSPERGKMAAQLEARPHLRWLACMASKALICGRNRETLRLCDQLLTLDPADSADARFTAAIAHAKLEDEQGLDELCRRCKEQPHLSGSGDAWTLLSRLALAHRRREPSLARRHLARIIELYPYALVTLARQRELPDGVFARLAVAPFSEDELVVAVSEATVLLQEGRDALARGTLGSWVLKECLAQASPEQLAELSDVLDDMGPGPGFMEAL